MREPAAPGGEVQASPETGRRRRRDMRPAPIWVPLVVGLMGLPIIVLGINFIRSELRFGDEGVTATGQVTRLHREISSSEDDDDGYDHYVDYTFVDAAGVMHRGSATVTASTYRSRRVGDSVVVTYLPTDPTTFRLGTSEPDLLVPYGVTALGGVLAIVGLAAFGFTLLRRLRQATPAVPASEFRIETTPVPDGPLTATFQRRATTMLDGVSAEGGGVGTFLVNVAIEGVAELARNRQAQPDVLSVGPAGLTIPGLGLLTWEAIAEIRQGETMLSIVPRDAAVLESLVPSGKTWTVGTVGGSLFGPAGRPALNLRLADVEGQDELVDSIARHRIVDVDTPTVTDGH